MTTKDLIQKLNEFPADMPVVLCNLNNDGDGDGAVSLPEIKSVEKNIAKSTTGRKIIECVFINFEQ